MLKISDRLIQVAGLVPENVRLADVGTDHGYVPIWLLEQGRISSAIAMDVNRGPFYVPGKTGINTAFRK